MSRVTDAMEQRAQRRITSADRVALSQRAGRSPLDDEGAQLETLGREVGYFHSMLMQCFLRQKPIPADQREWRCRATRPNRGGAVWPTTRSSDWGSTGCRTLIEGAFQRRTRGRRSSPRTAPQFSSASSGRAYRSDSPVTRPSLPEVRVPFAPPPSLRLRRLGARIGTMGREFPPVRGVLTEPPAGAVPEDRAPRIRWHAGRDSHPCPSGSKPGLGRSDPDLRLVGEISRPVRGSGLCERECLPQ